MAKIANAVSQLHGTVSREMWKGFAGCCEIKAITNAQSHAYWHDEVLETAFEKGDRKKAAKRKIEFKRELFDVVADQTGKLLDENVLTIVWARRFASYKRANLLLYDLEKFFRIISNAAYPCQVIWAGKPYPEDTASVDMFNEIVWKTRNMKGCTILTGYELGLSALLKRGADVWLNNPKIYRESSGTSGMTAAMNGCVNLSIPDGWVPEFAANGKNCFTVEPAERSLAESEQNRIEANRIYEVLETKIIPTYYEKPDQWFKIIARAHKDVVEQFDSKRMAREYYESLYLYQEE